MGCLMSVVVLVLSVVFIRILGLVNDRIDWEMVDRKAAIAREEAAEKFAEQIRIDNLNAKDAAIEKAERKAKAAADYERWWATRTAYIAKRPVLGRIKYWSGDIAAMAVALFMLLLAGAVILLILGVLASAGEAFPLFECIPSEWVRCDGT